jgi:molecular chaperone HtpG
VLFMTDRVDEWALNYLHEFDGTPLQSVAKGQVDLGKLQDEAEKKAAEEAAETFKPVLAKLKEALKDKAQDVRVTTRLVDSPACLVVTDGGMSLQLARLLKQAGQKAPEVKPVLEVNASHPLVQKLDGSPNFHDLAHILFDQALLAEGGMPEDPAAYVKRVNALLAIACGACFLQLTGPCRHSGRQPRHAGQSRRALMAASFHSSAPRTGARVPR